MTTDVKLGIRQDYLAYRLNNRELINLAQGLEKGEPVEKQLELYRTESHDEPGTYTPQELGSAHKTLGLASEFNELPQDTPWTPYQRALYRRMSQPEYDPTPYQNTPDTPGSSDFVRVVENKFNEWDRDGDTRLSTSDIDRAMSREDNTPEEDAALVILRSRINTLGACNPNDGNGVTNSDLIIFGRQGIPNAGIVTEKINEEFAKLVDKAHNLVQAGPILAEDYNMNHVNQNRLGSCVLLSTTTTAGTPEQIRGMFREDESGYTEIKFANGETELVAEPTRSERLFHSFTNDGGRWPAMLEIAVGQHIARTERTPDNSVRTAADGIPVETAFNLMADKSSHKISLDELSLNEARLVMVALNDVEGPKVCGSRAELPTQVPEHELEFLHNGIENSHCYAHLKYNPLTDEVSERNPWNRKLFVHSPEAQALNENSSAGESPQPTSGGTFTMPFPQFYASFRWIASSQPVGPEKAQIP